MKPEGSLLCSAGPPMDLILRLVIAVHSPTPCLNTSTFYYACYPFIYVGFCSGLFGPAFTTKILYARLISPVRTTRPAHIILLDLIIIIIIAEDYKLWKSSL
jgi:hypothetical protein